MSDSGSDDDEEESTESDRGLTVYWYAFCQCTDDYNTYVSCKFMFCYFLNKNALLFFRERILTFDRWKKNVPVTLAGNFFFY